MVMTRQDHRGDDCDRVKGEIFGGEVKQGSKTWRGQDRIICMPLKLPRIKTGLFLEKVTVRQELNSSTN